MPNRKSTGTIRDPEPPTADKKGFEFKTNDRLIILGLGTLDCDDCGEEHAYFDNLGTPLSHGDKVKFNHAKFEKGSKTKIAINLELDSISTTK